MREWRPGRTAALAVVMLMGQLTTVRAHALPGSVITLSPQGNDLTVALQMPVEDLTIAAPSLADLERIAPGQPLTQAQMQGLSRYLQDHMIFAVDGRVLPFALDHATPGHAAHHDVGAYAVLDLKLILADTSLPLSLTYDAVMHEVRNHRVAIIWSAPDASRIPITEFGYRPVDGVQPVIKLERP